MLWAKNKHGFTIVELLIVVVVIAILAAITVVAYTGIQQRARDSVRKSDAAQIAKALRLWSYDTGGQFSTMNNGNGVSANGWFDTSYAGTNSIRTILINSKHLSNKNLDDPRRSADSPSRWRYMVAPCTDSASDNRRLVLMELERAPEQTLAQQVSAHGCTSSYISTYQTNYRVNYAQMADAQ